MDADDWIDAEMYQDMYSHIINDEYDVVKCKLQKDTSSAPGNVLYASDYKQCDHDITFNPHNGFYMAVPPTDQRGINGEYGYIFTGLYKRNIIFDNDVFFPDWYKKYPVGKEPLRKRMLLDFLNEHETCTNLEFQQLQIRYVNDILQHQTCQ